MTADVMKKHELSGVYNSTGLRPQVIVNSQLTVAFAGLNLETGSYCLQLTVKEKDTGLIVMRVPYYFILYGTS